MGSRRSLRGLEIKKAAARNAKFMFSIRATAVQR